MKTGLACVTEASAYVKHVLDSYQAATLCKHVRNAVVLHVRDEFCGRAQHPTRLLSLRICLLFAMTKVPPALSTFDAFDTITFVIIAFIIVAFVIIAVAIMFICITAPSLSLRHDCITSSKHSAS